MHIEIARTGSSAAALALPSGKRPVGQVPMAQVDGRTVVEMAGLHPVPGLWVEGGGWMPASVPSAPAHAAHPAVPAAQLPAAWSAPVPSFFGQATNDVTPLLGGTAQAGCLVLVGVGGAVFCTSADSQGAWELDTGSAVPLSGRFDLGADGVKDLLVTSVDTLGNSSGIAGTFLLDTVPPPDPVLLTLSVDCATPLLRGTAEAGSSVMVGVGGAIYVVQADEAGQWRVDTAEIPAASGQLSLGGDGSKNLVMASTDLAGNTSTGEGRFLLASAWAPAERRRLA